MNSIKTILITLLLLMQLPAFAVQNHSGTPDDSTQIQVRTVDENVVTRLLRDPALQYQQQTNVVSLWERFKRWLQNLIQQLIETVDNANWFNFLITILAVLGMVYVILRLMRIDPLTLFYSTKKEKLIFGTLDEDIHAMDFDALISSALQRQEYRQAMRLVFLQALKILTDRQHVIWRPGKTNHDYLNELKAGEIKSGFNQLNYYFEYAWYGNFGVNEKLFHTMNHHFQQWKATL
jgi:hypothetical protein